MTKKLYLPFLMAMVVALMTSCSKKMGELSLSQYALVAGRGNIRGVEGARNAVATGLVLSYAQKGGL